MKYEYRVTTSADPYGYFEDEAPAPPPAGDGWRMHSHSTCYDSDDELVRITYVWEREAQSIAEAQS